MKRFFAIVSALIIVFSAAFSVNAKSAVISGPDTSKMNNYEINAELNTASRTLTATEKLTYVNNTPIQLNELYFHVYPNAFKTKESTPVVSFNGNLDNSYPSGFNSGYIDITSIKLNNNNLKYSISGTDKTILKVSLDKPLNPGDKIQLVLSFKDTIPVVIDRFGCYNNTYNLGNWYPIAAVYDSTGWNLDPFYKLGDPFYSDTSSYKVNITVPETFNVAATGSGTVSKPKNKKKTFTFQESPVRDFAWVAGSDLKVAQKKVDGVTVKCYYANGYEDKNKIALTAAENAIKTFDKYFGKYPYSTYSVVETNFPSGMEFPGIVLISNYYYSFIGSKSLAPTVVHETAHQWWYGVIGDNEIDEAWLDESFATYSEVIYSEKVDGAAAGKDYYNNRIVAVYDAQKISLKAGESVLMPLNKFNNWTDYGALVYRKGAIALSNLRSELGDDTFFAILQKYYNDFKFKNATTNDFINEVQNVSKSDMKAFFDRWIFN